MKESMIFPFRWLKSLEMLSDSEFRSMVKAIIEYAESGTEPSFVGAMLCAWTEYKQRIDIDSERYAKICERNRKNGIRGGRPKNPKEPKKPNGLSGFLEKPKETQQNPEKPKEPTPSPYNPIPFKKENSLTRVQEKAPAHFEFPQSINDIFELAKNPWCGERCSAEQADAYLTDRVARNWIPYGQHQQISSTRQICADLKKWLVRDQNNENERKMQNANNRNNFTGKYDPADDGSNV